jgi:hypothetical protein
MSASTQGEMQSAMDRFRLGAHPYEQLAGKFSVRRKFFISKRFLSMTRHIQRRLNDNNVICL